MDKRNGGRQQGKARHRRRVVFEFEIGSEMNDDGILRACPVNIFGAFEKSKNRSFEMHITN